MIKMWYKEVGLFMAESKKLHTKCKYVVYSIVCDSCGRYGADLNEREASINLALENGIRYYKGDNLCPECLAKKQKSEKE
jgi:hypothetical protein